MKILQIGRYPSVEVKEVPIPDPGPGEVLLKVEAVTTCPQWDLHLRHDAPMFPGHQFTYPYTLGQPGHEATGTIAALGENVAEFFQGDRMSTWRDPSHANPGCYAQYVVLAAENVIQVPKHLPYAATASLELAMCVAASILMLQEMKVLAGKRVAVNGLGPAGLIAAQMAQAEGAAQVIGFDLSRVRREYAQTHFGLEAVHSPQDNQVICFPSRPSTPYFDTGIDCVGAKSSVEWLMDHVQDTVALFGVQREIYFFQPRHYHPALRLCGYPGHTRTAAEYAVALILQGKLDLESLITHTMPLERYQEAIDLLEKQQAVKVCFTPWN